MIEEKVGWFKKTWKYVVTGVTCAVVGGGVMVGADVAKIQDTITKAQAKNAILAAAAYSAENVLLKVSAFSTATSKADAVKAVMEEVANSSDSFIQAATTVKDTVKEVKDEVVKAKEETKTTTNVTTPEVVKVKEEAKDTSKEVVKTTEVVKDTVEKK